MSRRNRVSAPRLRVIQDPAQEDAGLVWMARILNCGDQSRWPHPRQHRVPDRGRDAILATCAARPHRTPHARAGRQQRDAGSLSERRQGKRGFLLSQCEAEGFRHITWSIDRPDVLARYRLPACCSRSYPVLLAGGNPDGTGELEGGRHWARFFDPQPKPSYLFAIVAGRLAVIEDHHVTAQGRPVSLKIWAPAPVSRVAERGLPQGAMVWTSSDSGRNYQLDVQRGRHR